MSGRTPEEDYALASAARITHLLRSAQQVHTSDRKANETDRLLREARQKATRTIAEVIPLLTDTQREKLYSVITRSRRADQRDLGA